MQRGGRRLCAVCPHSRAHGPRAAYSRYMLRRAARPRASRPCSASNTPQTCHSARARPAWCAPGFSRCTPVATCATVRAVWGGSFSQSCAQKALARGGVAHVCLFKIEQRRLVRGAQRLQKAAWRPRRCSLCRRCSGTKWAPRPWAAAAQQRAVGLVGKRHGGIAFAHHAQQSVCLAVVAEDGLQIEAYLLPVLRSDGVDVKALGSPKLGSGQAVRSAALRKSNTVCTPRLL